MSEHVEEFDVEGLTVQIDWDDDRESPRSEWDHACRMVCWHDRYLLGDRKRSDRNPSAEDGTVFERPSDFQEWWKEHGKGGLISPLYLYDHSGITISMGPFSCPWDSGQVGWIYMTREMILENLGGANAKRVTRRLLELAKKCMASEVEEYDQYLTGQVYCYSVLDEHGDVLDSCCGMYGLEYCIEEATGIAKAHAKTYRNAELIEAQYA